ncbi:MAG: hypothetical protein M0012_03060 [Deltaproteobacteria bacterium]|nr:hypothetical protein [Deltaproteobacteria bacterium]
MIDNPAIFFNDIQFTAQFQALEGKITSLDKNLTSFLELVGSGKILDVKLIDTLDNLTGIFSFNGKLFNAQIPEDLYNEFALSSAAGANVSMKVKLQLSKIDNNEVTFRIVNDLNKGNIQKAVELYGKVYSNDIADNFKTALNEELNLNAGNIGVSVKGNFLFIHFNFNSGLGSGAVILTTNRAYGKELNDKKDGKKKLNKMPAGYSFMLEINLEPLGYIKVFSYYFNRTLTVNFKDYSKIAHNAITKNMKVFKDMLSLEGIALKEVSFYNKNNNKNTGMPNDVLLNHNIINERI